MLIDLAVKDFTTELASSSPAPGGGSVAALSGALGAALLAMVCRLSVGKKGCESFEDEIKDGLSQAERLHESLLSQVDLDTEAFNAVIAAFRMKKDTEEEKKARADAIQRGYKEAVQSPLKIAGECLSVLRVAEGLLGKINVNAASDIGVGALEAYAGLEGAIMNVQINTPSIKDQEFVAKVTSELKSFREEGARIKDRVEAGFHETVA